MPNSLIFIGERPSHLEMYIMGKPDFYDAIQLSARPHRLSSSMSYHSIPFHQSDISINIIESNSRFNCRQQSLQLIEGDKQLSEEDAYEIFTNFAIMEDNKVAFLLTSPNKKIRTRGRVTPKVLFASRKVEF
ncbi:hypothetical protein [Neobacillus vireti]|uniref:hypothetical protein n=1 Tax=Neobacillus vireti TaxID=220686 RepID=UPI0030009AD5